MKARQLQLIIIAMVLGIILLAPLSVAAYPLLHQSNMAGGTATDFSGQRGLGQVFNQTSTLTSYVWNLTAVELSLRGYNGETANDIRLRIWSCEYNSSSSSYYPSIKLYDDEYTFDTITSGSWGWVRFNLTYPISMDPSNDTRMAVTIDAFDSSEYAYRWQRDGTEGAGIYDGTLRNDYLVGSAADNLWTDENNTAYDETDVFYFRLWEDEPPPDLTPPQLNWTQPINGTTISNASEIISAGYYDASGVNESNVTLHLDGLDVTSLSAVGANAISYTPAAPLEYGAHIAWLNMTDNSSYGNNASFYWTWGIDEPPVPDTTAPVIEYELPAPDAEVHDLTPTIRANYTDDTGINGSYVFLTVNDINLTAFSIISNNSIVYTPQFSWEYGTYNVSLVVSDNSLSANKAWSNWSFEITPAKQPIPEPDIQEPDEELPPETELDAITEQFLSWIWWTILLIGGAAITAIPAFCKKAKCINKTAIGPALLTVGFIGFFFYLMGFTLLELIAQPIYVYVMLLGLSVILIDLAYYFSGKRKKNAKPYLYVGAIGFSLIIIGIIMYVIISTYIWLRDWLHV